MPKEEFINADSIKLHYIDWNGTGRPMVLLAGLGDTAHIYHSLAPKLANRFRVVGFTRRGHGRSARPDYGYDLDTLVKDIHHFLDALGLDQTILVGHSFAGLEISLFAIQYPHRVEGIVYLDALFPKLDPEPDFSDDPIWSLHPKGPTDDDLASYKAFLAYYKRARPDLARIWCEAIEADLMDKVMIKHDGRLVYHHDDELMNRIYEEVGTSRNPEYSKIKAPMLAVVPNGNYHPGVPLDASEELRCAADKYWKERLLPWIRQRTEVFRQTAPTSCVIELDSPNHRIFIAKEDETLKAIFNFLTN